MSDLKVNFKDLRTAVDWSILQFATPRSNRVSAIKQFVGSHYSDGGTDKRVPTNFLELAVTIYTRQLAAQAPRVLVTTGNQSLKPFARNTELALNQLPEEIGMGDTLRRAVVEAMFAMGVVKVGICASGQKILDHEYGEPYVDIVSLDDYFVDMSAKSHDAIQFEGNDYWISVDAAREMFNKNDLEPDKHTVTGSQGEKRAESVSSDEGADLYKEKIWLRDVWIPSEGKICTYGVKSHEILNIVEPDAPECGPYHTLGFSDVPGNLLPLPPIALWQDLHELGNSLFRKLGRQADSKKSVAAFQGGDDEDVQRLQRAQDGEGIRYSGQSPENITVGGIDAPTLAFYLQVRDLFSYFAGNLDTMGGLAPSTETVGQDKLLSEAASARLNHMREQTIGFAKGIFRSLAWYEWTDPVREREILKPLKGTDITIKRTWSEETREGDFMDYNFDIDVYSMQDDTPSTKLAKIGQALETYVVPFLPQIEAQGGQLDFQGLLGTVSTLANIPELADIVKFRDPVQDPVQGGSPVPSTKPANTKRTYERVSRSGGTRSGNDNALSRFLMGENVQGAEMAHIGKPTT